MGTPLLLRIFLVLWWLIGFVNIVVLGSQRSAGHTICDVQGCNCTVKVKPWKIAVCNLSDSQIVKLGTDGIDEKLMEISIDGGQLIEFQTKSFNSLEAMNTVLISNANKIVMDSKSFYNLSSSSLNVIIKNCDQLLIKTGAFDNMQGFVSADIIGINYVQIERSAFFKLYQTIFQNIPHLVIAERAFEFKGYGNPKHQGPPTGVTFDNVSIPKIQKEVFVSPLADINFKNSRIERIESKAFYAVKFPAICIINTTINRIESGAFDERTLTELLKISRSRINTLESGAITSGIKQLEISHSTLDIIETKSIEATVAEVRLIDNQINSFQRQGFGFNYWNTIEIENNIIDKLYVNFIDIDTKNYDSQMNRKFVFKSNEINQIQQNTFNFMPDLKGNLVFDDNLFTQLCNCSLVSWFEKLFNSTYIDDFINSSYCTIDRELSKCFNISDEVLKMPQFLQKACQNNVECLPQDDAYKSNEVWLDNEDIIAKSRRTWLILIVGTAILLLLGLLATFVVLLIRGSRWLKRKGYFRNIHYRHEEPSNDEENTIVTVDMDNEKLEIPEELTQEFLEILKKRLENPDTQQEATEMIERLYEMFIIDDNYGNNHNLAEEDPHLYEELGNLNRQIPPPPYKEESPPPLPAACAGNAGYSGGLYGGSIAEGMDGARDILKIMENKLNFQTTGDGDNIDLREIKPQLNGDYSEPSDAAEHLYSELKNKCDKSDRANTSEYASNNMALRPLPDKPAKSEKQARDLFFSSMLTPIPGPSSSSTPFMQ